MTAAVLHRMNLQIRMAVKMKRWICSAPLTILRNQVVIETDEPVLFDLLGDIVVCTEDRLPVSGEIFFRLETEEGMIRVKQNGQILALGSQIRSWLFGIFTC